MSAAQNEEPRNDQQSPKPEPNNPLPVQPAQNSDPASEGRPAPQGHSALSNGADSSELPHLPEREGEGDDNGLVPIIYSNQSLHEVAAIVDRAIRKKNNPPTLFQSAEGLIQLRKDPITGKVYTAPLTLFGLRYYLDRVATWSMNSSKGEKPKLIFTPPPLDFVQDRLHAPEWDSTIIPVLERVTETPVFVKAGRLLDKPGYDVEARLYYQPSPGLVIRPVSPNPTAGEIARAKSLFFKDLFRDFPFKDDNNASKAHALAAVLQHFVRDMIDGSTPLHLISAATPGTGKGLLADCIAIVITGRPAETTPQIKNDEEMRKAITAALLGKPAYILLDNLEGLLNSPILANCLTSPQWTDRILGKSEMSHLPVRCIWMASGNNIELSLELCRRTIVIRLEAPMERPWERDPTKFAHHPLNEWASKNRGDLIWAALTLVQNWIAGGKQPGQKPLGRFESYTEVVGGILAAADIQGFLANTENLYATIGGGADDELRVFFEVWFKERGETAFSTKDAHAFATEKELLPSYVTKTDNPKQLDSEKKKLGRMLSGKIGSHFGSIKLVSAGKDTHSGTRLFKIVKATAATPDGSLPGAGSPWERILDLIWYGNEDTPFPATKVRGFVEGFEAFPEITTLPAGERDQKVAEELARMTEAPVGTFKVQRVEPTADAPAQFQLAIVEGQRKPPSVGEEQKQRLLHELPALEEDHCQYALKKYYYAVNTGCVTARFFTVLADNNLTWYELAESSDLCHFLWQHKDDRVVAATDILNLMVDYNRLTHLVPATAEPERGEQLRRLMNRLINRPLGDFRIIHPQRDEVPEEFKGKPLDGLYRLEVMPGHTPPPQMIELPPNPDDSLLT